jgi:hypothetical protein
LIDLAQLESCTDLTSEHAKQAASSSAEMRTLLKRVGEIAKPGEGCPKLMMALARLVGQDWIDGDLRVEISGDDASTTIIIMSEHGIGIRERILPVARFSVPIDEFERALELAPRLVLPLRISDEAGKLVLTPLGSPEGRMTAPPVSLDVDSQSLGDGERTTAPPPADELQVVDEAMPDEVVDDALWNEVTTSPPPGEKAGGEAEPRMESGPVPSASNPKPEEQRISNVHTRPTVRRMLAVDAAAIAAVKRRDPRREED